MSTTSNKTEPAFKVGDKVYFSKPNGYKNEGEVVGIEHFGKTYNYKVVWPNGSEGRYMQSLLRDGRKPFGNPCAEVKLTLTGVASAIHPALLPPVKKAKRKTPPPPWNI